MANRSSNFPTNQLNTLESGISADTINKLTLLRMSTKPETDAEFDERVTQYLNICAENDIRVGIETLCLHMGITRTTLFNWCRGDGCSQHRAESARMAKQIVISFLEQLNLLGRLNPASAIFYLKNWASYSDSIDIDASNENERINQPKTIEQILREHGVNANDSSSIFIEPPELDF